MSIRIDFQQTIGKIKPMNAVNNGKATPIAVCVPMYSVLYLEIKESK